MVFIEPNFLSLVVIVLATGFIVWFIMDWVGEKEVKK